jgi:histidine phosphotransferase ChpT
MSMPVTLEALDLAALLCSRVCHDLISPVGAVVNGVEVMEDDADEQTKAFAIELIKKSATTASARLQFCRIAFGAAGSAGASIDTAMPRAWRAACWRTRRPSSPGACRGCCCRKTG